VYAVANYAGQNVSSFLQFRGEFFLLQACDITDGMYLKIPQPTGLLQYLLVSKKPFCLGCLDLGRRSRNFLLFRLETSRVCLSNQTKTKMFILS
jgi:Transcription factor Tfb4